ncbi:hypothetical protein [Streptomyces hirsutus]|uniref:hypothetical protein n=1 Tax=Streptomyces hirsutus TaxID=35620 RepID=UPI0036A7555F
MSQRTHTSIRSLLHDLADFLLLEPARPIEMGRIGVRFRMLGAAPDGIALLPDGTGSTHHDYAARLRRIADGGEGPRAGSQPMTCCGKTMRREGTKWVCSKCGAWHEPGTRTALLALADRLDTQPSRSADIYTVRGWARSAGLTSDWVDLLPHPAGAHHSAYATRLRALAS